MTQRHAPAVLVALAASLLATPAAADWPVARHDGQRTATASGTSSITAPAPYWQYYLGGTLSDSTHIAVDINQDGVVDIVYLAGGKAIAKLPDNQVEWASPPIELTTIDAVADVIGDGGLELVANSARGAVVISGKTGQVLWTEPAGEVGDPTGVRVGDVNGDGVADVVIEDCACCGTSATVASPGGVYSFAGGAAALLWHPPSHEHCGSSAFVLGDWDGDGVLDVGYGDGSAYMFVDGKTGAVLGTSAAINPIEYYATCDTANVDGRPGDEVVCYGDSYEASIGGSRSVFVGTYDTADSPPVQVLWNEALPDPLNDELDAVGASLADLDGDGTYEVTVGAYVSGAWTTYVYDAATGATLATLPGNDELAGIADLNGNGKPEVLVYAVGSGLEAWTFTRGATPAVAQNWTLSGPQVVTEEDWSKTPLNTSNSKTLTLDLTGSGTSNPVFYVAGTGSSPDALTAYQAGGSQTPTTLASYAYPTDVTLLTHQVFSKVNRPYDQLLVTRNDGYLVVLDDTFAPTNAVMAGVTGARPGMLVGGFTGAPIAPNLGGALDNVIVTDSRGYLLRLDPTGAWLGQPPATTWQLANTSSPTAVPGLNGASVGIACSQGASLTALSAAGATLWTTSLPGGLDFDPLFGDVNGDGVPDIFGAYDTAGSVLSFQVYDGTSGAPVWASPPTAALQYGYEPFAVADYDGDGATDLWAVLNTLQVWSGSTGAQLAQNTNFLAYFIPTIADVDFDGVNDVTMSGGLFPARTFEHDLNTTVWVGSDDRPYADGARAVCGAAPAQTSIWVQPSTQTPGLVRLIDMNGAAGAAPDAGLQETTLYLAGGMASASPPPTAYLGTLGNVTVKQQLLGATSTHPSALVPSADGYIYALDPCAGTLDWSYDMGFPPGEVIFADTSGDGVDEMLVTAADGYLYAFSQSLLPAPAYVYDTDPTHGITNAEASAVTTCSTLNASWAAVPGADAYQLAVTTAGGSFVTEPDWIDVGNVTQAATNDLPLASGAKYFQLVRAISMTQGSSPSTSSSGVTVTVVCTAPDGGPVPDAGRDASVDAGHDASVDARRDAGTDAKAHPTADAGRGAPRDGGSNADGGGAGGSSSGCSCDVGATTRGSAPWLVCLATLLALVARRFEASRRRILRR